ncbi:antA/AntB antirepressor family protein [Escherichia coli]|uniref:antA/AntB antirepressor family protein n=1 Tax=Escherichia coli TaxID=562 RepID=UPI000BE20EAC|nr:antA/AntB antirepressor family protein [Escherichia coli]
MAAQLIPIFNGTISNETHLLCNARDLHAYLGVGKVFAAWITSRITEYEFIENQDYILLSKTGKQSSGVRGGHNRKDYHLTLDTAKELAMVERNEKGRQIRRYFIECEKKLHQRETSEPVFKGDGRMLLIHFDERGQVEFTEQVPEGAMVCTFEHFQRYLRQRGWIVAPRDELRDCLSSAVQNL